MIYGFYNFEKIGESKNPELMTASLFVKLLKNV